MLFLINQLVLFSTTQHDDQIKLKAQKRIIGDYYLMDGTLNDIKPKSKSIFLTTCNYIRIEVDINIVLFTKKTSTVILHLGMAKSST